MLKIKLQTALICLLCVNWFWLWSCISLHAHNVLMVIFNSSSGRDVRSSNFISVCFRFGFWKKNSDSVWNDFGSVWRTRFGSDIVVIYYLYNTWVVNLQQILQHYCAVLNELCIHYSKLGFSRVLKCFYLHTECK